MVFVSGVTQGNEDTRSVQYHPVVFLVETRRTRRQGESEIPLCKPSGGKLLLRPSSDYNRLLESVACRTLSNIYDGVSPRI